MRLVDFGPDRAWPIEDYGSELVTLAPLTKPLAMGADLQAACFRLGAGGRIGRHPATVPQLLAVVAGSGWVSGSDGHPEQVVSGQAALWAAGEEHETWTDEGFTAIVIESEALQPR